MSTYRLHLGDKPLDTLRIRSTTDRGRLDHQSGDGSEPILEIALDESTLQVIMKAGEAVHSTLEIPFKLNPRSAEGVQLTLEDAGDPARLLVGPSPVRTEQPPPRLYATYIWPAGRRTFSLAILLGSDHAVLLPRLEGRA